MKKIQLKKCILPTLLILMSSLLLWNCETEEALLVDQTQTHLNSGKSFERHVVPLKSLEAEHYEAFQILSKLSKKGLDPTNRNQENYSEEYDLYYTLDEVYVIEAQDYEQFSFVVRSSDQQENQFKNYLLYVYPNNEYQQFLVTYQYNDIEEGSFNPVNITELQGSQLLTRSVVNCPNDAELVPQTGTVCTYTLCTGDNHHMYGQSGCTCGVEDPCEPATETCVEQTYYVWQCGGGSTGGGTNDCDRCTTDDNNSNGQTGGGDQTGGNNTGDDSIPVFPIPEDLKLNIFIASLDAEKRAWWDDPENSAMVHQLKRHLLEHNYSALAEEYVRGSIELEQIANCQNTQYTTCITLHYNPGKINNRDEFAYTHIGSDGAKTAFKLVTGELVVSSPSKLMINGSENGIWTSEVSNTKYYYIKANGIWAQLLIKENITSLADELKEMFRLAALDLGQFLGTYVIPIEDIKIIVTGTDFEGEPASRWLAAGMLLTEVVAVGKVFKAVKVVVEGTEAWRIVRKVGNKTYTRVVTRLTEPTLDLYKTFTNNLQGLVDQAHRSGEVLDDVVEETAEILQDEFTRKGSKKLTWAEIKALWKRGNDFNDKAVDEDWYPLNEIHLENGKRLDSYNPILGEIVSRKATDLDNIQFSTFIKYLSEFTSKYKVGTKIRSNAHPTFDGNLLDGTYYLEIPMSNQSLPNIQDYINYAWDNYQVKLRFRPE